MDGKIFVTFVSLVMLSYIKNKMSEKELYKKYTTQELFDELDLIESYERGNEKLKLGEVTKKQKEIFKYMDEKTCKSCSCGKICRIERCLHKYQ